MYLLESLRDLTVDFIELEELIYISKLNLYFILHILHLSSRKGRLLKLFLCHLNNLHMP